MVPFVDRFLKEHPEAEGAFQRVGGGCFVQSYNGAASELVLGITVVGEGGDRRLTLAFERWMVAEAGRELKQAGKEVDLISLRDTVVPRIYEDPLRREEVELYSGGL